MKGEGKGGLPVIAVTAGEPAGIGPDICLALARRAFEARSQAGLIAAIMGAQPPALSAAVPGVPPALDRLVQRCLAKDADDRWQSAADLASELKWIAQGSAVSGAPGLTVSGAPMPSGAGAPELHAPAGARPGRGERFAWAGLTLALLATIAVLLGRSFFSPAVSKVLLEGYLGDAGGQEVEDNLALLTDREREVLQLIAEGKTNKEIATLLSVSINTIETHRKHIMEKLDLHNTAEIVRFAVRKKIVQ